MKQIVGILLFLCSVSKTTTKALTTRPHEHSEKNALGLLVDPFPSHIPHQHRSTGKPKAQNVGEYQLRQSPANISKHADDGSVWGGFLGVYIEGEPRGPQIINPTEYLLEPTPIGDTGGHPNARQDLAHSNQLETKELSNQTTNQITPPVHPKDQSVYNQSPTADNAATSRTEKTPLHPNADTKPANSQHTTSRTSAKTNEASKCNGCNANAKNAMKMQSPANEIVGTQSSSNQNDQAKTQPNRSDSHTPKPKKETVCLVFDFYKEQC